MINKVTKINNLGIFADYKWDNSLQSFNRFTLIFGWNGSGKTTFSRLFSALGNGIHAKYPNLKYEIDADEGKFSQTKPYLRKVMVFNKEYIEENSPSLEDPAMASKHIFVLGKEDKELAKKLQDNKKTLDALEKMLVKDDLKQGMISLTKQLDNKEKEYEELFTNIARSIASLRSGDAVRQYQKPQALESFAKMEQKYVLSEEDEKNNKSLLRQELLEEAPELDINKINQEKENLKKTLIDSQDLLRTTIQRAFIKRLDDNPDIVGWVEQGLSIHKKHKSSKCEYCQQEISAKRIDELAHYFNNAHNKLMNEIADAVLGLQKSWVSINTLGVQDKTAFYKDLQPEYEDKKQGFEQAKKTLLAEIQKLGELLKSKRLQTNKALIAEGLDTKVLEIAIEALNEVIRKHNNRSKTFSKAQDSAFNKLERHYLSSVFDPAKSLKKDIAELKKDIESKETETGALKKQIREDESKQRTTKEGCDALNKGLLELLGRNELIFEDTDYGYLIKRNGEVAENLSDGEKVSIAFIYFLTHLTSEDFDLKETVVVIDDPISSLDLDAIYKISGLIKGKLRNAHQLIIMTHNYEFFNQMKRWFVFDPMIAFNDKDKDKVHGEMLMIKNPFNKTRTTRTAEITELDKLLRDYESEYHYLFKKLSHFEKDIVEKDDGTIEAVYQYPNIARKTLECFLSFRVPEAGSFYVKLKGLRRFDEKNISHEELENIYDFLNSNSHLETKTGLVQFDPMLARNGKEYIRMTLELIKKADGEHYKSMLKLVR